MTAPIKFETGYFIELIQEYEFLWRKQHQDHKDKGKCNKAWEEIAAKTGLDGLKEAKQKWRALTDYYSKLKKPKPTGTPGGKENKWPFKTAMSFLDKEKASSSSRIDSIDEAMDSKEKSADSSRVNSSMEEELSMDDFDEEGLKILSENFESPTTPARKRSHMEFEQKKNNEPDELDKCIMGVAEQIKASIASGSSSPNGQFGTYVGSELKQLASPERDLAKLEIMQLFARIKSQKRGIIYTNE